MISTLIGFLVFVISWGMYFVLVQLIFKRRERG